jgi:DNA-binding NtrC family response regulator
MQACVRATPREPVVMPEAKRSESAHEAAAAVAGEGVYESPKMREVCAQLRRLATRNLPVLILGETGTGKELAARMLHEAGPRKDAPLRVVNCGAIPENLVASVLFGHERGAFTGADRAREGVFEDARGGTVFLDEVGELSPSAQAALLRALETRRITRVGGTREIEIDARFIAATHRNLEAMAEAGEFRLDLLHRLNTVTVVLPPLRERREEIRALVDYFLEHASREWGTRRAQVEPAALSLLEQHSWPGNLRELRNVLARAAALVEGDMITVAELPEGLRQRGTVQPSRATIPAPATDLRSHLRDVERDLITGALEKSGGNQRRAAELLGMPLRTFERRLAVLKDDEE